MRMCETHRAMFRTGAVALLLVVGGGLVVAACSAAAAGEPDVRKVSIEVTSSGFAPDTVRLAAGAPAELIFTRTTSSGCASQVHIPDLGIGKTPLPQGEPVTIRVAPEEAGTFAFLCAMNMLRGTIIVTDAATARDGS
jgi:plastocyanin domain-containing protein